MDDDELSMLSANKVYTTYCDTPITPNNPKSLAEARRSPEWPDWEKAVQAELNQLHKMGTWVLVNPPKERTPVSNKWVLTKGQFGHREHFIQNSEIKYSTVT